MVYYFSHHLGNNKARSTRRQLQLKMMISSRSLDCVMGDYRFRNWYKQSYLLIICPSSHYQRFHTLTKLNFITFTWTKHKLLHVIGQVASYPYCSNSPPIKQPILWLLVTDRVCCCRSPVPLSVSWRIFSRLTLTSSGLFSGLASSHTRPQHSAAPGL